MLNPAVKPARDLAAHLGDHTVWHYPGAVIKLLPGGDHALSDYDLHLGAVLDFLDLLPAEKARAEKEKPQ